MSSVGLAALFLVSAELTRGNEEPEALWEQALAAEARLECETALERLLQLERLRPSDAIVLQKIAQLYSDLMDDLPDPAARKRHAQLALKYSLRAVELEPESAVNVLSVAISHGKLASEGDIRARVEHSREVKRWAEKALALDPQYSWSHHVLGRWHLGVAEVSGAARWWLRVFYGGLPDATNEQAVEWLERAVALAPQEASHHIELGFAHLATGNRTAARTALAHGLSLPTRSKYDQQSKRRAQAALATLN